MAAPESVYTGVLDSPSNTETKVVRLTSSPETTPVLKDRFYLDVFLDGSALGQSGMWAGGCRVGSPNYYMHNVSRIGWPTLWKDGFEYVIFWDAGLNTLGEAKYISLINKYGYGVVVTVYVKSAYYVDTNTISVKWRKSSSSEWQYNSIASNVKQGDDGYAELLLSSANSDIIGNEYIYITAININAEGNREDIVKSIFVPAAGDRYGFGIYGSYAFADYDQLTSPIYYFNQQYISIGAEMYKDENLLINANVGYYANDTIWIKVENIGGKSVITKSANVGNWDTGDPATPVRFTTRYFIGWASSYTIGCANINSLNPVAIYLDNIDNVYRMTASPTGQLATGFFYTGTTSAPPLPSPEFIRIANGVTNNYYYNCKQGWTPLPD